MNVFDKMDINYQEVTSELDAREILRYLNYLGIHNISGEVLKYFITDLKKLIKYDLQQKNQDKNEFHQFEMQWPERLHSASTFSSRIKARRTLDDPVLKCSRGCLPKEPLQLRNIHSAPSLSKKEVIDKPVRRACSCVRVQKRQESNSKENRTISSNNLIKVPRQPIKKKCDPVSLYHYYSSLWEKYKDNVPGENNWSELRWRIRQKMAGASKQSLCKIPESQTEKVSIPTKNLR